MKTHHYPDITAALDALTPLWHDGDVIAVADPPIIAVYDLGTLYVVTEYDPCQDLAQPTDANLLRERHPLSLATALEMIRAEPGTYRYAAPFAPVPTRAKYEYQASVTGPGTPQHPHSWLVHHYPLDGERTLVGWILVSLPTDRHTAVHIDGTAVATQTGDHAASAVRKALVDYDIEHTSLTPLWGPVKTGSASMGLPEQQED